MRGPAPSLLQKRIRLALDVSEAAALQACEEACRDCGLAVAARADRSLVLLPLPTHSVLKCILPVSSLPGQQAGAGRGLTAEIVPSRTADGRLSISITADRTGKGKAFIKAVRPRLRACGTIMKNQSPSSQLPALLTHKAEVCLKPCAAEAVGTHASCLDSERFVETDVAESTAAGTDEAEDVKDDQAFPFTDHRGQCEEVQEDVNGGVVKEDVKVESDCEKTCWDRQESSTIQQV